nr:HAD family hydrolase [uncultured Bacteroides sp.]
MKDKIEFIAFDADDTLWENELDFQEFEQKFCNLLSEYLPSVEVTQELFKTEMKNLHAYGYGLKSIMLSMIETACRITNGNESIRCAEEIIRIGQGLLEKPVKLLENVKEVLSRLHGEYKLVLATKGDLFDQRRKIVASGLQEYFCHIEIMSDKKTPDYIKLLGTLNCPPENFLMIGNSIKSDIIPILELGGYAAHIPHHVTWAFEQHEGEVDYPNFIPLNDIKELLKYI